MYSTVQDSSGWDGGTDAEQRLEAALAEVATILADALAAPMLSLRPEKLGRLFDLHRADEAMMSALKLAMVARAEACDVAKTTGAPTTAVWLRTAQRMGRRDAYAAVALARDLDRTVTLTAAALARGEVSFRHAQVIAAAIKDLPQWIGLEQRVQGEEYLIDESLRRSPDDVRLLGRHLLLVLAPEEWERRLGEELDAAERAAERRRSLKYLPNGIPGSETMIVKLPVLEMETLRKIIEALIAADTRPEPDERPLDQKRGDAFAELVTRMAEWQASPNRGRGRDCVTVGLAQLLQGTGFGTIDDTTPVRPIPCGCQTPDATRQAKRKNRKQGDGKQGTSKQSDGGTDTAGTTGTTNFKPTKNKSGEGTGDTQREAGTRSGVPTPDATRDLRETAGPAGGVDPSKAGTDTTTTGRKGQPDNDNRPPDPAELADPTHPAAVAERIAGRREPRQQPQQNTATGTGLTKAHPEANAEPEERCLGEMDDACADSDRGDDATRPDAANDSNNQLDPHDGCTKCGGGGSARILGLRGEPLSVATIRRMACDANIIPVVLGGNGEILDIGTADRFFTEPQRRALAIRDGSHCHFPGCHVPERRCIAHHMNPWEDFGPTDLANGVLLCKTHHTYVHHKGWTVRMGNHGHPEYTPPEWVDPQQKVQRP
ncbi:HNH endonuclease signature motif containing protein [Actinopolymorpha singaporensis]|uniref:HNH nuclease domain-containing protein n=1 Tax=Actinopolymorpha singaporensis TaxID=117157 RepID=A0A1H1WSS3_9ACTN|nr:HNH endonuclease signature motif containing protein [Actinopolymorpha singaporensis]SDT00308.1 protein of unknown function [Actinopolymorpha singaporensis]